GPVVAEDLDFLAVAQRDLQDEGDEMGLDLAVLALPGPRAGDVEVAQARGAQAVGAGVGGDGVVDGQLRRAVRVRRRGGHVLGDGHLLRLAVGGGGGGEHEVVRARGAHGVEQRQRSADVAVPVLGRVGDGFADERAGREVDDAVEGGVVALGLGQDVTREIGDIALDEDGALGDALPVAGGQVVQDGDLVALVEQDLRAHAAHVTGAAGDQEPHLRTTITAWDRVSGMSSEWSPRDRVTRPGWTSTSASAPGMTPAVFRRFMYVGSTCRISLICRTVTAYGPPSGRSDRRTASAGISAPAGTSSSSRPGIGLPKGERVNSSSTFSRRRSTSSLMTCSQRHASSWTLSHSRPMTSVSRRSASRCLRITAVARERPSSESLRLRSGATVSRPSRSMRATVWLTVGPDCARRSAMRARRGMMPSSSSSKMVRKYISVVSTRSLTAVLRVFELRATRPGPRTGVDRRGPGRVKIGVAAHGGS